MLPAGATIDGRYEILELLGAGGMGEVYRARRLLLDDIVALKLIRPGAVGDDGAARERFLRESRAAARLRHPGIVSILDFAADSTGRPYLVMEHLNGPSLADELRVRGRFEPGALEAVLRPVCDALQLAHAAGIVHRDLKPTNVVSHRYDTGEVVWKVIDFGLASLIDAEATRLTAAHEVLGTIAYAAPEQLTGAPVDARTDVYALGVIVFELLSGRQPFLSDTAAGVVGQVLGAPPPDLSEMRPDLPAPVCAAVRRAMAKVPAERWPSVAAFSQQVLSGAPDPSAQPDPLMATYAVGRRLARGRLGSEIFEGVHRALGHPVAIRILRLAGRPDAEAVRARFLVEARALQVTHPNIVHVRDFGESAGRVYLVTDLLEGDSLAEALGGGPLAPGRVVRFVTQLADATAAIHQRGGLICGLHPEIIRVVREAGGEKLAVSSAGVCGVADLLATLDEQALRGRGSAESELPYVAPEVLMGQTATPRSDLFTIGVLAYRMATGRLPYVAASLPELIGSMLRTDPSPALSEAPGLSGARRAVIAACLAPSPADRPAAAADVLTAWRAG